MYQQIRDTAHHESAKVDPVMAQMTSKEMSLRQERQFQIAALNLFTAIVVADEKILQIEIDTYTEALKACFTEELFSELEYDFLEEAQKIKKVLSGPAKRYWLGIQHMKLRDFPDHHLLLDKLWRISISDKCLDSREADIIDFFTHLWRKN